MNERIRELAKQAGYSKDMFGVGHWDMPECKKFAELILKECADYAEYQLQIGGTNADKIKQHFGVE